MNITTKYDLNDVVYWFDDDSMEIVRGTISAIYPAIDGVCDHINYSVDISDSEIAHVSESVLHRDKNGAAKAQIDRLEDELIKLRGTLK